MKKLLIVLTVFLCAFSFFGCEKQLSAQTFVMNTFLSQSVMGSKEVISENESIARNIENKFSKTIKGSDIYLLNEKKELDLSEDEKYVFETAKSVSEKTHNALDITLGSLSALWDIGGENHIPSQTEIDTALTGKGDICFNGEKIVIGENTAVDLGAVVKGYALDEMGENTKNSGIKSALIDLGGSICAVGKRSDGRNFKIGIRDPLGKEGSYMATVELADTCSSTSGIYERYFESGKKRYHHIFDGNTGAPAQSGLLAVTVINEKGILTDAYSTALFVLGAKDGKKIAEENGIDALFITEAKKIITTEGFGGKYSLEITGEYEACF